MNKIYLSQLEESDDYLLKALTSCNIDLLHNYLHPEIVLTNENGEVFNGIKNMPENNPEILKIKTVAVEERTIALFDTVAVINSIEIRTGEYRGLDFKGQYRLTRVWKRCGRWKLIGSTVVLI